MADGKGNDNPDLWTPTYIDNEARQMGTDSCFTKAAVRMARQVLLLERQLSQAKDMCLALAAVVERRNEEVDKLRLDARSDFNLIEFLQYCVDNDKDPQCRDVLTRLRTRLLNSAVNKGIRIREAFAGERDIYNGVIKVPRDAKGRIKA